MTDFLCPQIDFVDAARTQPQLTIVDMRARLRSAIQRARSFPGWGAIPVIFIPENGPPGAPSHLWEFIKDMQPIICMAEAGASSNLVQTLGVPKTQDSTLAMKDNTVRRIADGSLAFSDRFFSLEHIDRGQNNKETLDKLQNQMLNYRHNIKKKYGENYNDDCLISVMMLMEWSDKFNTLRLHGKRPAYTAFYRKYIGMH